MKKSEEDSNHVSDEIFLRERMEVSIGLSCLVDRLITLGGFILAIGDNWLTFLRVRKWSTATLLTISSCKADGGLEVAFGLVNLIGVTA